MKSNQIVKRKFSLKPSWKLVALTPNLSTLLAILLTTSIVLASVSGYNLYMQAFPHTATYTIEDYTGVGNYRAIKYDGSTWWDSTNASYTIISAISNIPSVGGTVYFMGGNYTLPTTITPLKDNLRIKGEGRESVTLFLNDGVNDNVIYDSQNHDYLVVEDLTIDGNRDGQTSSGATGGTNGIFLVGQYGAGGYRPLLRNIRIHDAYDSGIKLNTTNGGTYGVGAQFWNVNSELNGLHGLEINSGVADTKVFGGVYSGNGNKASPSIGDGLHFESGTSSIMVNNPHIGAESGKYNRYGIYWNGGWGTVQGGYIQKSNEDAIYFDSSASRVTVQGVGFVSVGQRTNNTYSGVYQTGSQNGFEITNNQFTSEGGASGAKMLYAVKITGGNYHIVSFNNSWGIYNATAFDVVGASSDVVYNNDWG